MDVQQNLIELAEKAATKSEADTLTGDCHPNCAEFMRGLATAMKASRHRPTQGVFSILASVLHTLLTNPEDLDELCFKAITAMHPEAVNAIMADMDAAGIPRPFTTPQAPKTGPVSMKDLMNLLANGEAVPGSVEVAPGVHAINLGDLLSNLGAPPAAPDPDVSNGKGADLGADAEK